MGNTEILEALYPLILKHGKPQFIRSGNGREFTAEALRAWLKTIGVKPIQTYPGNPRENGYNERFNGTLRNEVLNAEWFASIEQAKTVIGKQLKQYNHIRPHQALRRDGRSRKLYQKLAHSFGAGQCVQPPRYRPFYYGVSGTGGQEAATGQL